MVYVQVHYIPILGILQLFFHRDIKFQICITTLSVYKNIHNERATNFSSKLIALLSNVMQDFKHHSKLFCPELSRRRRFFDRSECKSRTKCFTANTTDYSYFRHRHCNDRTLCMLPHHLFRCQKQRKHIFFRLRHYRYFHNIRTTLLHKAKPRYNFFFWRSFLKIMVRCYHFYSIQMRRFYDCIYLICPGKRFCIHRSAKPVLLPSHSTLHIHSFQSLSPRLLLMCEM